MFNYDDYEKCINITIRNGFIKIKCKMGLWRVSGRFAYHVEKEAYHLWNQYKDDGEYSSIIGGKSAVELLLYKELKMDIPELLESASSELKSLIAFKNDILKSMVIASDLLDEPEYNDYQTCHDLMVAAKELQER